MGDMRTRKIIIDDDVSNVVQFGSYGLNNDNIPAVVDTVLITGDRPLDNVQYFVRIRSNLIPGYLIDDAGYRYIPAIPKTDQNGLIPIEKSGMYFSLSNFGKTATAKFVEEKQNFSEEKDAIVDYLIQHLSIIRTELWFAYSYGLPLIDKLKIKVPIDTAVASIVESTPGVISLVNFTSIIKDHKYSASMIISTIYGNINLSI